VLGRVTARTASPCSRFRRLVEGMTFASEDAATGAPMPNCPTCDRPMATIITREDERVRTYYECPTSSRRPSLPAQEEAEPPTPEEQ
jgi:hypothetical protein